MKNIFLFTSLIYFGIGYSQDIIGTWNGIIKVQGTEMRLVFNIDKTDEGYSATLDSPDQMAEGIPVSSVTFKGSTLKLAIPDYTIEYKGKLTKDNVIEGTFKQAGQSYQLDLSKGIIEKKSPLRPQEPIEPFPYYTEDVAFENKKDSIKLEGTLTLPSKEGNFPVVILISGSGAQDRNEEILGHKPFLVLADHLTRNGIGVLRYDDRGTGLSTGNFALATTEDLTRDVEAAIAYLKTRNEINPNKIGLIGHSEGGIIAPIVASRNPMIHNIVLLAGTGIPGNKLLLLQQELILRAEGASEKEIEQMIGLNQQIFDLIVQSNNLDSLQLDLSDLLLEHIDEVPKSTKPKGMSDQDFLDLQISSILTPWLIYFLKYDPSIVLKEVKCPVLAINGDKDLQVPSQINLAAIKHGLETGGNNNVTIIEFPGLNHLFQECTSGSPSEYSKIEQTFSPVALNEITNWLTLQFK